MPTNSNNHLSLIAAVLHDLEIDAEAVLNLAKALEHQAASTPSHAPPQQYREIAALVKSAALALLLAAANVVGASERITLVAALLEVEGPAGGLPS